MRTLMTLAFLLILWTGSAAAEIAEPPAVPATDTEAASSTMTSPAMTSSSMKASAKPSCGEATGLGGDLSYLSFEVRPQPFPNECIDCTPCSLQGHCGVDSNGYFLGVCSPPGSSYCHYLSYSACTCY
ncbi:MAG: hypothetical protein SX243_22220 [Acidobacteriota bacterium]|nr:hypothetical protein [Acidobacteriota bacterium]